MEIRIENTIRIKELELLKDNLNNFFKTDFQVIVDGDYTFFRDLT